VTVLRELRLWHGGVPGLKPGDLIAPDPTRVEHLVDGCDVCEARRRGAPLATDDNDAALVYVTTDRDYARLYAADYPRGDLYRVAVDTDIAVPSNDPLPSWGVPTARVLAVYDRMVTLTPGQLRKWRRYAA
jgi:hypothetical protein